MVLSHGVGGSDESVHSTFASRYVRTSLPRFRMPEQSIPKEAAYQIINDELMLDGNPRLNLASFVTTWMEPECDKLIQASVNKNYVDMDEYPVTTELQNRCVNIIAHLFNAPLGDSETAVGVGTVGSSEAIMLAGLAFKRRWQNKMKAAGKPCDKPNIVTGANVQVRPRSFLADWPVSGPVPAGMLRPVSDPDVNGNVRSFRPDLEQKSAQNQNWPRFSSSPRPGTEPDLLPSGSVPAHTRARDDSSCRAEVTAGRRGATTERCGATAGRRPSPSSSFSPISPAPFRVGEGEPPPSWDPVPTPEAMVAKGSPKLNMIARGSPKLHKFLGTTSGIKKKASPKCSKTKKTGGSPRVKQRAEWNPALEKSLVDILHEYKDSGYRGDNGWSSEGWNKMVKEFHLRNKYVNYTKSQIQDKEVQLKRDYRMLKEARQQSGASWNEDRHMVEGTPAMWANLEVSYPKIKKFWNSKARFPLFDALGELYDGHLAEGTYNVTSLEPPQEEAPLIQIHDVDDLDSVEAYEVLDEDDSVTEMQTSEAVVERSGQRDQENEVVDVERSEQQRTTTSSKKHEKQKKKPKNKGERIEEMMGRYLDMRTKQVQDESADLAKEKEDGQANDFSIKRCISVLSTMEVTKEEKAKAFAVFIKSKENRETFLSGCELDQEATLIWLKNAMV